MKILLLNPLVDIDGISFHSRGKSITLGPLYLSSIAKRRGHSVRVEIINKYDVVSYLKDYKPDIVGISCMSAQYPATRKIIDSVKEYDESIKVVAGGYFPTFKPDKFLTETKVDHIFMGEAEKSWKEFLEKMENNEKISEEIITGGNANINSLPLPDRDAVNIDVVNIYSSRGCTHNCYFCSIKNFYDGRRSRSVEDVVSELKTMEKSGYKRANFIDDNFLSDADFIERLCKKLIDVGLDMDLGCMARCDDLVRNQELIDLMKKAGFDLVEVGVQNFNADHLKEYKVGFNLDSVREFLRLCRRHDDLSFILFYILNTEAISKVRKDKRSIKETFKDKAYKNIRLNLFFLTPYPGSDNYEQAKTSYGDPRFLDVFVFLGDNDQGEMINLYVELSELLYAKGLSKRESGSLMASIFTKLPLAYTTFEAFNILTSSFPSTIKLQLTKDLLKTQFNNLGSSYFRKKYLFNSKKKLYL